ncbi:Aldolase vrtJ [Lachnellula cervina]|uniref:Aldolase vrtJ n=1 Tax=Lachnellula cervina TaxID=1316786 RepID=A0A7D8YJZ3_9HELO|nr:Aldolase vrtJ [Lachnellula cervina]
MASEPAILPVGETEGNTWLHPGTAAFDFRSDTKTCPTRSMLEAVCRASHGDDVSRSDSITNDLEAHVASLTSRDAALFVLSGTMGNQIALHSLLNQPPHSVLCDDRSHVFNNEAGSISSLSGALVIPVTASNGQYMTLEDILKRVDLRSTVHSCPTRVICLENTLAGMIMPLSETRRISEFARSHGIKLHLDGARLWEAVAAGAGTLTEYCSLFDTVSLSFSKGLGAPVGGILVGSYEVIGRARWVRQSIGGGVRQPGLLTAAARVAIDETFAGGLLARSHKMAEVVAEHWVKCGGKLKYPTQTNMVWLDLESQRFSLNELTEKGQKEGLLISRDRLVFHYRMFASLFLTWTHSQY